MLSPVIQRSRTACILIGIFILMYCLPPLFFSLLLVTILIYILRYEWPQLCPYAGYKGFLITLCYPVVPFVLMISMNEYYRIACMQMFILVSSFDAGAYIVGSLWGTHPLLPRISPAKTWEGVAGGLICAGIISWTFLTPLFSFPFLIALCTAALLGDLFESWLKRRAGVKDSAAILPGHGGFLDRFDSHMAAIVVLYALRRWL